MATWPAIWEGRWIWAGPPPVEPAVMMDPRGVPSPETWNRFCFLRRGFELGRAPRSAPARVTADSRYVLLVNGREVSRGPARAIPERITWAEVDLGPHLRRGENVVAALVRFYGRPVPWWRPVEPSNQLGFGSFLFEAPSLGIASDSSWRGRPAPYRGDTGSGSRRLPSAPTEVVDGSRWPRGWADRGFDDGGWEAATELDGGFLASDPRRVPCEPFPAPEHDDIDRLTALSIPLHLHQTVEVAPSDSDDPIEAERTARKADELAARSQTVRVYDAGRITLATPWAEVDGPAGTNVDIYAGEDLRTDGTVEVRPRSYALRWELAGDGPEVIEGFDGVGFRYLAVVPRGDVEVRAVGAVERRYPREDGASFSCDDDRLEKIWRTGARTLDVCSTDAFLDCPGREQRAWLGDSYVHALVTYVTNPDWRLVRRHLRLCAQSRRGDGLLTMSAGGDLSMVATTIPDYSLHWLRALARWVEHTGDVDTARELLPAAAGVVAAFERWRGDDGLLRGVPGWVFVDWAQTQRSEVVGALDALYAAALDDHAWLLDQVGDGDAARASRELADRTRVAFDLLWDADRGVYVDAADGGGRLGRVSQQTNAAAILGGCAPADRWPRMLDRILDDARVVVTGTPGDLPGVAILGQWADPSETRVFDEQEHVVAAQPFFAHFLHQAVVAAGRRDLVPDLCLRWWPQLERGNTTFEEYWDAPAGRSSRAHAWSATPTYDLTTHVLGVRPDAPGYTAVRVEPLLGSVGDMHGSVPTPHGIVTVTVAGETVEVDAPPGVEVRRG